MDIYKLVLDIFKHPENYTSDRLPELLGEPEMREIYNLLCRTYSAIEAMRDIDVDDDRKVFTANFDGQYIWTSD